MSAGPDSSYNDLRTRAREQVNSGCLPARLVDSVNAGYGSSVKVCSLCSQPITPKQVEYEVLGYGKEPFSLHVACYTAWRDECLERSLERSAASQAANPPPPPAAGAAEPR